MNKFLADDFTGYRDTRLFHGIFITAYQGMPPGQWPAFSQAPVSAAWRQMVQELGQSFRGQGKTVRYLSKTRSIAIAAIARLLQMTAGNTGEV
jgi:hypothetical protein